MRENLTRLYAHIFALLFTGMLLLVSVSYFQTQPLVSALILFIFAIVYLAAGFASKQQLTCYPGLLLLVLVFNLILFGVGIHPMVFPFATSWLAFAMYPLARWLSRKGPNYFASALSGSALIVTASLVGYTLIQMRGFDLFGYFNASLTFSVLALAIGLRSLMEFRTWHRWVFVFLSVPAFLSMLRSNPIYAEYFATFVIAVVSLWNIRRNQLFRESILMTAIAVSLDLASYYKAPASSVPAVYATGALSLVWFYISLYRRPQDVTPALGTAWLLTVIPLVLSFPWDNSGELFALMSLVACLYLVLGSILVGREQHLPGIIFGHIHLAIGEIAAVVPLIYAGWKDLPATYSSAGVGLLVAASAVVAAWTNKPLVFKYRRHLYYWAGLFVGTSFLIALWRPNRLLNAPTNLWLMAFVVLALYAIAARVALRIDGITLDTLFELPAIVVALTGAVYIANSPHTWSINLLLPVVLALPGMWFYFKSQQVSALASSIVAAAILLVDILLAAGLAFLGVSLVFFALVCLLAFWQARSNFQLPSSNFQVQYLRLVALATATLVAVGMIFPWQFPEVFLISALAMVYLLAAAFTPDKPTVVAPAASPLDMKAKVASAAKYLNRQIVRFGLEAASYALMALSAGAVVFHGAWLVGAILALAYSCAFFVMVIRHRQVLYLYPAGAFLILGTFIFTLMFSRSVEYLAWAFPLTLTFYVVGTRLRASSDWMAKATQPLYQGGHLNASIGVFAFLLFASRLDNPVILIGAIIHVALYAWLAYYRRESLFLAGVGLSVALLLLVGLSFVPSVQRSMVMGYVVPLALILFAYGLLLRRNKQSIGSTAAFVAAGTLSLVSAGVALWGVGLNTLSVWIVLIVGSLVWLGLLWLTRLDIFVYLITATLALLGYSFLRAFDDRFMSHVFIFMVYGCLLIALIFLFDLVKAHMRFRVPVHLSRKIVRYDWIVLAIPTVVLSTVALAGFGIESISTPTLCNLCHSMNTYYASWVDSPHARAGVGCADCHTDPNVQSFIKNRIGGIAQVVKTMTGARMTRLMVAVNDSSCLRDGCHAAMGTRATQVASRSGFPHASHIQKTLRGVNVRCAVCHSMSNPDQHFTIDQNACLLCHFSGRGTKSTAIGACQMCHASILTQSTGAFSHQTIATNRMPLECADCHKSITTGDGKLKDACSACHLEYTSTLLLQPMAKIHAIHLDQVGVQCDICHSKIEHGQGGIKTLPRIPANHAGRNQCLLCHATGTGSATKTPTATLDHAKFTDDDNAAFCRACHLNVQ